MNVGNARGGMHNYYKISKRIFDFHCSPYSKQTVCELRIKCSLVYLHMCIYLSYSLTYLVTMHQHEICVLNYNNLNCNIFRKPPLLATIHFGGKLKCTLLYSSVWYSRTSNIQTPVCHFHHKNIHMKNLCR